MTIISNAIISHLTDKKAEKIKDCEKRLQSFLATNKDPDSIQQARQANLEEMEDINHFFDPVNWMTAAAKKADKISLATHSPKFTHSASKGSSFSYLHDIVEKPEYLTTASLVSKAIDAFGSSASLDVAKVLMITVDGNSLASELRNGDAGSLLAFSDDLELVEMWRQGLVMALSDETLTCDSKQKQVYFPVQDNPLNTEYHLVCPLTSSSMAYQLHKSIAECRYGDSVDVRKARKSGNYSNSIDQKFPDLAYLNIGGANPQNVSLLNSSRGGTFFLLNAAPPAFKGLRKTIVNKESVFCADHSIFSDNFDEKTASLVRRFIYFIESSLPRSSTVELRTKREVEYTLPIVDVLLQHASIIQSYKEAGWSLSAKCNMKQSHSLWLDPMNPDLKFQAARESKEWIDGVATDFADWLVSKLPSSLFDLGDAEHYYFKKTCLDELVVFERSTPKLGVK